MKASLVYDGVGEPRIPESMGLPKPNQLQGTPKEKLGELASRICYDSLGSGRSSEELHKHILEVINLSVYEHLVFTIGIQHNGHSHLMELIQNCANRKGIWIEWDDEFFNITANFRAILEWEKKTSSFQKETQLGGLLGYYASILAPQIVSQKAFPAYMRRERVSLFCTDQMSEDQAHITLYLSGSRGFCYLPDTEILTKDGWKMITDIKDDETLLTLNPKTKKAEWQQNKQLHAFDYHGRIYWMESSQWKSPGVTREHLMWAAKYDLRDRRDMGSEEIMEQFAEKIPMETLSGKRFVVDHRINLDGVKDPEITTINGFDYETEHLFAWLGWMATDGCVDGASCRITQLKEWNHPGIQALMNSLFGVRSVSSGNVFAINDKALAAWVVEMIGPKKDQRNLCPLFEYSPRLINCFLDCVILGDGNKNINYNGSGIHEVVYTSYYSTAQQYQTLFALTGRSSNIRHDDRVGMERKLKSGQEFTNKLVGYIVSIHEKGVSLVKKGHHRCQQYTGKVYCPRTDNGVVYVRRGGMAFWCSNTHEQVRHRFAISQRSTRYVDEDGSEYVIHPLIKEYMISDEPVDEKDLILKAMQTSVAADRQTYSGLVTFLEAFCIKRGIDKKSARKQARGAARGFLGNALESEMLFTAPVSGWKNILSQRLNEFADAEIREVYAVALPALKSSVYGYMFDDYETVPSPDGLGVVLGSQRSSEKDNES